MRGFLRFNVWFMVGVKFVVRLWKGSIVVCERRKDGKWNCEGILFFVGYSM